MESKTILIAILFVVYVIGALSILRMKLDDFDYMIGFILSYLFFGLVGLVITITAIVNF